ncbi:MAG: hypothetical protein JST58_09900 [Bacteroidetes bacterium]|nr:hypothetical protein [Bacteroidota bacterium]
MGLGKKWADVQNSSAPTIQLHLLAGRKCFKFPFFAKPFYVVGNPKMTHRFTIIERIISITLLLIGAIELYILVTDISTFIEIGIRYKKFQTETIPVFSIIKHYHLTALLSVSTIIAGLILLISKKSGWTITVIVLLTNCFFVFIPYGGRHTGFDSNNEEYFVKALWSLFFLSLLFIMLLKPIRQKYSPTYKKYLTAIAITALLLIDRAFI